MFILNFFQPDLQLLENISGLSQYKNAYTSAHRQNKHMFRGFILVRKQEIILYIFHLNQLDFFL